MCGEKSALSALVVKELGSPPHVRGKAKFINTAQNADGITPACAGKSPLFNLRVPAVKDHPRMCGEKRWAVVH